MKKISFSMIMTVLLVISVILSGCGAKTTTTDVPNDPKELLIGKWNNERDNVVVEFFEDGTLVSSEDGEILGEYGYGVEVKDNKSIFVQTHESFEMNFVFIDENTMEMESDGNRLTRIK